MHDMLMDANKRGTLAVQSLNKLQMTKNYYTIFKHQMFHIEIKLEYSAIFCHVHV